jgi:Zn-dependent peptidase ImmA (M78 family)/DNA-binding XRE family transcriptional regulator
MDLVTLSANLRRIRAAKRMSQGDVALAAGLSRPGYRNLESGTSEPRSETLMSLAAALEVRLDELLAPVRQLSAVRFRARKKMTMRGEILARAATWLDNYNGLEMLLNDRRDFKLVPIRKKLGQHKGLDRAKKAAELAREDMGIANQAIRNISGLLEANGVKLFTPPCASEGFFGLSIAETDGGPAVLVNTWERLSVERWIFTAAHELGHLLLHLDSYDGAEIQEDPQQEKEADTFASHFLMPENIFKQEMQSARGLPLVKLVFKLKRIFRVSWRSVLYRIGSTPPNELGSLIARFQVQYRSIAGHTLSNTDEPECLAAEAFYPERPPAKAADEPDHLVGDDFLEDRLNGLVRRAVEEDKISLSRAAEILGCDLLKMRDLANSWVA